jgi:hypothetical protein
MSPAIGPVAVGEKPGEVFVGRDLAHMGNVAAQTLELVDEETRRIVREAEDTAQKVVAANASLLEDLANTLLRSETLSGPALEVFLAGVKPWPKSLLPARAARKTEVKLRVGGEADDATGEMQGTSEEFGWPEPPETSDA